MRIVLQKVSQASVSVNGDVVGTIGQGYVLLVCAIEGDSNVQADVLTQKIVNLRLFEGDNGKINDKSILDIDGEILVVSQFTLSAGLSKGNRPDFTEAAKPDVAEPLVEYIVDTLRDLGVSRVEKGKFGAFMEVCLTNFGPVTLYLEY